MIAFIFPGQGSQKVGMGTQLADASAAAREVFGEVDEVCEFSNSLCSSLCWFLQRATSGGFNYYLF